MLPIRLIVGLGNIGSTYVDTRHNAGERLVQNLAENLSCSLRLEAKFHGFVGQCHTQAHKITLLYPNTYMNNSGLAVAKLAKFYQFDAEEILVAHDDLDLECGDIRLKKFGGHGGHNGLRDIMNHLGSEKFYRLRIGIGHPGSRHKVLNYVLSKPSTADKLKIDDAIDRAISHMGDIIQGNHQRLMNQLHQKP